MLPLRRTNQVTFVEGSGAERKMTIELNGGQRRVVYHQVPAAAPPLPTEEDDSTEVDEANQPDAEVLQRSQRAGATRGRTKKVRETVRPRPYPVSRPVTVEGRAKRGRHQFQQVLHVQDTFVAYGHTYWRCQVRKDGAVQDCKLLDHVAKTYVEFQVKNGHPEPTYVVERISDGGHQDTDGDKVFYWVHWKGFPHEPSRMSREDLLVQNVPVPEVQVRPAEPKVQVRSEEPEVQVRSPAPACRLATLYEAALRAGPEAGGGGGGGGHRRKATPRQSLPLLHVYDTKKVDGKTVWICDVLQDGQTLKVEMPDHKARALIPYQHRQGHLAPTYTHAHISPPFREGAEGPTYYWVQRQGFDKQVRMSAAEVKADEQQKRDLGVL